MGLPLRLQIAGATSHVTFRAVDEQLYFADDIDRRRHLALLAQVAIRYEWLVLGWCQMGTHGHLLVKTPHPNLSAGMQLLTSTYVRRFNQRRGRSGALVSRRFFSTVIESESHLLEAVRYLPLNPERAGICDRPEDWPWSSYRATIGLDPAPEHLAVAELLRLFGRDPLEARERYAAFVRDGLRERNRPLATRLGL